MDWAFAYLLIRQPHRNVFSLTHICNILLLAEILQEWFETSSN